ncbi:hypothetical protein ACHAXA_008747 [Cyclostephanos tholiformis]|uniref:SYO1-like TPR repeats domain-containing protein n=1 Tax=Cyclostephanos tholiformis TaxID=382380 RepID=A0ABD3RBE5_9STRA
MAGLPLTLLRFFRCWVEFPSAFATALRAINLAPHDVINNGSIVEDVETANSLKANNLPALATRDIDEILSTCVLCLGNVVSCNLLAVGSSGADEEKSNVNDLFWQNLVSMLNADDHNHHRHVTSLILSLLLHNQPRSQITLVDMTTLDRLISLLLTHRIATADTTAVESDDGEIDDDEVILQMQRNIILILGKMCTSTHSETMDTKVCRALLSQLTLAVSNGDDTSIVVGNARKQDREWQHQEQRKLVIITHEILNVLMDMYGNDDCHEQVFVKECVLDHFRRCIPWFKRTIKRLAANSSSRIKKDHMVEEGFVWNETALNATRFIKYKQNH